VVVIVWWLDLQLPMQTVPIITNVVRVGIFFNCSVGVAFLIDSLHNLCNDLTVSSSCFNQDPNTGTTLHKYFILSEFISSSSY
jgi:hypothetical protein